MTKGDYSMRLLGITGRLKSGKDTAFLILQKQLSPLPVVRLGFADALKDDVCKMCGCTRDFLEKHKDNFRSLLQGYGTDVRRKLWGEDYWIGRLGAAIRTEADKQVPPYLLVITDVRFLNEAKFLEDIGGKLWRIERNQLGDSGTAHISETESDRIPVHTTICNNHSMLEFEHEIQLGWMRTFTAAKK